MNEKNQKVKKRKATISSDENKSINNDRIRKLTQNSTNNNFDSDELKKHSIFDIVGNEPAFISMYDKDMTRSCKNMQK